MKKFFGLVLVMAAFCVLVSCTSDSNTSSTGAAEVGPETKAAADKKEAKTEYAVGDIGPAGGVIFYDDEADGTDDIPGVRYLEAVISSRIIIGALPKERMSMRGDSTSLTACKVHTPKGFPTGSGPFGLFNNYCRRFI